MTFLRNHDELTLEMVTPEERQWMWEQYAPDPRMRLNLGIRRRLAPLLDNDRRRWLALNAMFLSLPGTPIIYYGDGIGMGEDIWLPDRYGVRTPMQWSAAPNAGFSTAEMTYLPVIDDEVYGYQRVNVAAQEQDPDSYLALTLFLVHARQERPSLRAGEMSWVETGNKAVLAYIRRTADEQVLCVFNLSDTPQPLGFELQEDVVDLLARERVVLAAGSPLTLAPYAAHWLWSAD
jgi:maltose alpha-D-glucosyltransferase/alpha-amylase